MFAHTLFFWLLVAGLSDGISLRRGEFRLKVPVLDLSDAFSNVRRTFSDASINIRLGKDKEEDANNYKGDVYYSNFVYPLPAYPPWPPYPIHPPPTNAPTNSTTPRTTPMTTPRTTSMTRPTPSPTNDPIENGGNGTRAYPHEDPAESQQTVSRRRFITYLLVPRRKLKIEELTPGSWPVY